MAEELYTGLDIGSSTTRVVVGQVTNDAEGNESLQIIGAVSVPTEGMSRGSVSSIEEVVSSISKALERAERMTGIAIPSAWVSIAGQKIGVQEHRGAIGVSRPDGEIQENDVARAIEAAQLVAMPSNFETLHVLPKSYTVDGQAGVKNPVGMTGIKLEVEAMIIQTLSSQIRNLTKCVHRTGLEIDDLVFTPLATSEAVLTRKQKELGVCLVDIGSTSTSIVVYEEGEIIHTAVIPMGGDHITHDIGMVLRVSLDVAKLIKHSLGHALPSKIEKDEYYNLKDFGAQTDEEEKLLKLAGIVNARVQDIYEAVDAELAKVDRSGMLPAGIVLTGGSLHLPGMVEVAKQKLRLSAEIGYPSNVFSVIDEVGDPAYASAVGLVMWGYSVKGSSRRLIKFDLSVVKKLFQKVVKMIKKIIP